MSFHVEGQNLEKVREPTVESLVRGIWRLGVSEAEREYSQHYSFFCSASPHKAIFYCNPLQH